MTNAIQVFNYEDTPIRTYRDESGEVWLVAKDVCNVLGIVDSHVAIRELDTDEKGRCNIPTPGGIQPMSIINEPGLYKLAFKSRKPGAKKFTRWVTHEVLPSIRKTGSYTAPEAVTPEGMQEPLPLRVRIAGILQRLALQVSDDTIREHINRESYRYATGEELPQSAPKTKPKQKEKPKHTPRRWTLQQVGALLKWSADAVLHRAEQLGMTQKAKYGYWDGGEWYFSKEGRQKFLELVRAGVMKIEDGYEYYENGFKRIHWDFNADAARI